MVSTLEEHDAFFGRIISMIPRELYKHEEEVLETASKYYKHKKVALSTDEKKRISKKKKAEKYGAIGSGSGDNDGAEEGDNYDIEDAESVGDDEGNSKGDIKGGADADEGDKFATLRERLQAKLSGMKTSRMSKKRAMPATGPARSPKKQKGDHPSSGNKKKGAADTINIHATGGSADEDSGATTTDGSSILVESLSAGPDLDFSSFKTKGKKNLTKAPKGKPGTKKQRLERMLETAEKKRERLNELRNSGERGRERVRTEQWNELIGAASGKETIDINKVKKALKRREQAKVKSAKEWSERTKSVERHEKEGIAKREANISARKQSKINRLAGLPEDGKDSKGTKGTKEGGRNKAEALSNRKRAGFEGKTGTFLNKKKASGSKTTA